MSISEVPKIKVMNSIAVICATPRGGNPGMRAVDLAVFLLLRKIKFLNQTDFFALTHLRISITKNSNTNRSVNLHRKTTSVSSYGETFY